MRPALDKWTSSGDTPVAVWMAFNRRLKPPPLVLFAALIIPAAMSTVPHTLEPVHFSPQTIYCGDCLESLSQFPANSVDLIYIDPPFLDLLR